MSDAPAIILALFAGVLLGAAFFGGLWWTVRRGVASKQPALWFGVSLVLRTAVTITGFYYVTRGDWRKLVACLAGFALGRVVVTLAVRITPLPGQLEEGTR